MAQGGDIEKGIAEVSQGAGQVDQDPPDTSPEQRPACFQNNFQELMFTFVATMAVGTASFATGLVTVMSTFVAKDLDMNSAEVTWIAAASALTSGAFLLGFGRLCDLFGRKSILVGSLAIFTILCLGAGFTQSGIALDILHGMLGLASASAIPAALGILGAVYERPSKRKNHAFACFAAGNPLGYVFGMVIAGIATQVASWRASYWVLAIIFLLTTIVSAYSTPTDTSEKSKWSRETLKKFDLLGIGLCIVGVATFSAALTEGSEAPEGWKTPYVIVLLVVGILSTAAFVFWESRSIYALIPMYVWRDRNFSLLVSILALGFLGFPAAIFWIALFFQRVWHLSPIEVAVHMLPAAISGTIVNIVAGLILHKVSNKLLMSVGSCAYTIAFLLLSLNKSTSSYWAFAFPALTIMVIGADFQFNVVNMYIMTARSKEEQSTSGGILLTVTELCATIGFGIATALFNSQQREPTLGTYWKDDPAEPYAAVFWYATAVAGVSILLLPFLTIKTQGHDTSSEEAAETPSSTREEKEVKI